jgi:yecA family protein
MLNRPTGSATVIPFPTRFSEVDRETLLELFSQRRTGIRFFLALHGFLTAIAIGPTPIPQDIWLGTVWGHRKPPSPLDQRRIARLREPVLRFHASIVESLRPGRESFRIHRDLFADGDPDTQAYAASVWCDGFYKGMRLDRASWTWLKKHEPALLRPMWVFGTSLGICYRVRSSFGERCATKLWAPRLEPAVLAIRDYWRSAPRLSQAR